MQNKKEKTGRIVKGISPNQIYECRYYMVEWLWWIIFDLTGEMEF